MKFIILILLLKINYATAQENIIKKIKQYDSQYSDNTNDTLLFISIKEQRMYHIIDDIIINYYIISSSEKGTGNKEGSNKTPLGWHRIRHKYGDKTPLNGKMEGRVYKGEVAEIYNDHTKSKTDDITSRIFWLEGIEAGINQGRGIDSFKRYIYIHGTSEEGRLGQPASHGCIRMKNKDVVNLYNLIEVGTLVLIL